MKEKLENSNIKALLQWVEKELVLVKDELKSIEFKPSSLQVKKRLTELKVEKLNLEYVIKNIREKLKD
jgi:hypothetical protein